jgi:epoxyqueuosine reductase
MLSKEKIIERALELGFDDIGFTTAEPFESQQELLTEREEEYAWTKMGGLDLMEGTDPKKVMPEAKSIIVLLEFYFKESFPPDIEPHFGRCYLDDDRVTQDGLSLRIKEFTDFLGESGISSEVPFNVPHRISAARAGLGTFGKNNFLYGNEKGRQSSWVLPLAILVDHEFEPDEPNIKVGCPDWCRNACIAACPTRAIKKPNKLDPRKCISFLSYYGPGPTPLELREPMGQWIYGCDHCQNVCPRNRAWLAQELPVNERVAAKAGDFELTKLLHMDKDYFESKIWPHMFYMPLDDMWRWKMNVARVIGNTLDKKYVPELIRAFKENDDERITCIIAWSLGRIGGEEAKAALDEFLGESEGDVKAEVEQALAMC